MKNDIFISYSRHDTNVVNELVTLLEQEGYSVWIDRDGIESGDDFKRVILKAIKESKVVLFFSSEHSNVSEWTAKEIGVAVKYKKHIIPIMLDDSNFNEAVEFDLINLDYVDYSKALTRLAMRERLFKTLRNKLGMGSNESERLESERKAKEEAERARLEKERMAKAEAERLAKEAAERKRLEEERRSEEARLKAEEERKAKERAEAERLAKEAAEKKRLEEARRLEEERWKAAREGGKKVPEGAINGVFSVSPTKKVYFSKGNLQYQMSTGVWRFAEKQYDFVGEGNAVKILKKRDWIDLFGWGTSGWNSGAVCYKPEDTSTGKWDYNVGKDWRKQLLGDCANADWAVYNAISNGGGRAGLWRVLTEEEWGYLLFRRNTISNNRFAKSIVNGVKGVVVFPDNWHDSLIKFTEINGGESGYNSNVIKLTEWAVLEQAGLVFLPAAGYRDGKSYYIGGLESAGKYWASNGSIVFDDPWFNIGQGMERCLGFSVRPVSSAQ